MNFYRPYCCCDKMSETINFYAVSTHYGLLFDKFSNVGFWHHISRPLIVSMAKTERQRQREEGVGGDWGSIPPFDDIRPVTYVFHFSLI